MPKGTPAIEKKPAGKPAAKEQEPFLIVAIGASSGGLEAITELLQHLPPDTGMAFIFIQHLSPDYKSNLTSLLARATKMVVQEIDDMERMKPDNIYVMPNDKGIEVTDGHIKLVTRRRNGPAVTIDVLFTSLAETHFENAIGVVLSGNASDGTLGLKAIKAGGGITFAQDNSARNHGMPDSAIKEGVADFILPPKEIAIQLVAISKYNSKRLKKITPGNEIAIDDNDPDLNKVLEYLHEGVGVDFGHYKMSTVKRRIQRRMFFHKASTIKQYAKLLKTNKEELGLLYNDLLINVTDFFRDTEAFRHFKATLFPKLIKNKKQGETLRIWVVACSTGQEAFSIAMLLIELMGNHITDKDVQIFATDLSEQAIKKARAGIYTADEVKLVTTERLERFFTRVEGNYRISKSVRDLCAFAPHNILSNPPFSHIDFISCCNLLIYLDTVLQKKMFVTFHYALNDGGCLMLGRSETIGTSQLFTAVDRKFKIYTRNDGARSLPDLLSRAPRRTNNENSSELFKDSAKPQYLPAVTTTIDSILFTRYIPAYVVINYAMEIVQFKGDTARYLEHGTGRATLNIMNMARPEIAFDLLGAIHKAIETQQDVHKPEIEIRHNGIMYDLALDVIPLNADGKEAQLLVVFKEMAQIPLPENGPGDSKGISSLKNLSIKNLKESLALARAELLSVAEEKEKAYRIMQAAKDEILSRNEEFQCLNEELETSKEEIESANEELITTNQELQTRNEQLGEAYEFSKAIVTTLHEPMLILDNHLRIKSANKAFYKKFQVRLKDTEGKLLYELGEGEWDTPDLRDLLEDIIQKETHFYDHEVTRTFQHIGKRTMLLNARRIQQKVNKELLILLAVTDITEKNRKRKEETKELEDIISERTKELKASYKDLKGKNVALEKMNKELEMFTFLSSHDLQEPLRKIRNFASCLLDEQQQLNDTGKDYLRRMQDTACRMQQLIEDLLAYSRVKGKPLSVDKIDLNEVVTDVLTDFDVLIKEKDAVVEVGELCELRIIRFQFRQLIYNLISNSLKFSGEGRRPKISIKGSVISSDQRKEADLVPGTDYCHIVFTDNGIGFDPQYKDRIFEVFQRLHVYDEYKGTGIGLAICKRIVDNHNGVITATGRPGKGARFDIYIPATD